MGMVWDETPTEAFMGLTLAYEDAIVAAVYKVMDFFRPQIEADMRASATWTDRTGNARQSLWAALDWVGEALVIVIGHGMPYGFWLEVIQAGKFAIIAPTLDKWMPRIWSAVKALLA
jgi:hypothetical protein